MTLVVNPSVQSTPKIDHILLAHVILKDKHENREKFLEIRLSFEIEEGPLMKELETFKEKKNKKNEKSL